MVYLHTKVVDKQIGQVLSIEVIIEINDDSKTWIIRANDVALML
jgi:hypothetical protein